MIHQDELRESGLSFRKSRPEIDFSLELCLCSFENLLMRKIVIMKNSKQTSWGYIPGSGVVVGTNAGEQIERKV